MRREQTLTLEGSNAGRRRAWPAIPTRLLVVAALVLAVAGTGLAAYLAYENIQGQAGVCTVTHSCATVQKSSYGKLMGVPVSVPGLGLYALLALGAAAWLRDVRGQRGAIAFFAFNGALFGFLFSGYLTYAEAFLIDAWCIYCVASASLMTLLLLLWGSVLRRAVKERG